MARRRRLHLANSKKWRAAGSGYAGIARRQSLTRHGQRRNINHDRRQHDSCAEIEWYRMKRDKWQTALFDAGKLNHLNIADHHRAGVVN